MGKSPSYMVLCALSKGARLGGLKIDFIISVYVNVYSFYIAEGYFLGAD